MISQNCQITENNRTLNNRIRHLVVPEKCYLMFLGPLYHICFSTCFQCFNGLDDSYKDFQTFLSFNRSLLTFFLSDHFWSPHLIFSRSSSRKTTCSPLFFLDDQTIVLSSIMYVFGHVLQFNLGVSPSARMKCCIFMRGDCTLTLRVGEQGGRGG